jgi:hypothetical protein
MFHPLILHLHSLPSTTLFKKPSGKKHGQRLAPVAQVSQTWSKTIGKCQEKKRNKEEEEEDQINLQKRLLTSRGK